MADNKQVMITTNSFGMFDKEGTLLSLSYVGTGLGITFGYPERQEDGRNKYPKDKRNHLFINAERAVALHGKIMSKIMPALKNGEPANTGIFLNKKKDSIFEVGVDVEGNFRITYYTGIDENRKPAGTQKYFFEALDTIDFYDPETTDFTPDKVHAQFAMFVKFLEGANPINTMAEAHANRLITRRKNELMIEYLTEIATKLGCSIDRGSYQGSNSGFIESQGPVDNSIHEVNNFEDFMN